MHSAQERRLDDVQVCADKLEKQALGLTVKGANLLGRFMGSHKCGL